jgi:hypothetical protein
MFLIFLLLLYTIKSSSENGDPYGLVTRTQTDCELQSLTQGSRLADAFSSFDEHTELISRIQHDFIQENILFTTSKMRNLKKIVR